MSASRIAPKLYQGSHPSFVGELHRAKIHTLVLCAVELQPDESALPGIEVLRCPYVDVDDPMGLSTLRMVEQAATAVARRVSRKQRTLVTCAQGLNRSGLVAGLALVLSGMEPNAAIALLREKRCDMVLCNETFRNWLSRYRERLL